MPVGLCHEKRDQCFLIRETPLGIDLVTEVAGGGGVGEGAHHSIKLQPTVLLVAVRRELRTSAEIGNSHLEYGPVHSCLRCICLKVVNSKEGALQVLEGIEAGTRGLKAVHLNCLQIIQKLLLRLLLLL